MAIGENSLLMMLLEFLSFAGRTIQKIPQRALRHFANLI